MLSERSSSEEDTNWREDTPILRELIGGLRELKVAFSFSLMVITIHIAVRELKRA